MFQVSDFRTMALVFLEVSSKGFLFFLLTTDASTTKVELSDLSSLKNGEDQLSFG